MRATAHHFGDDCGICCGNTDKHVPIVRVFSKILKNHPLVTLDLYGNVLRDSGAGALLQVRDAISLCSVTPKTKVT